MRYLYTLLSLGWLGLSVGLQAADYRTRTSGDWHTITTWEIDQGGWTAASEPPGFTDLVLIRPGHQVSINQDDAIAAGVTIAENALLALLNANMALVIYNGLPGADLVVLGQWHDNANSGSGNGLAFVGGATWRLGPGATLLKTNNSSATVYRDAYEGGMAGIPASAEWVIQYTGQGNPSFSTVDTYYPHLTFVSAAGNWNPAIGASRFQGSSGTATVLGNLTVGSGVSLYNQNTSADPLTIQGDLLVSTGALFTNVGQQIGTGLRVGGLVWVDGTLDLASGGSGLLQLAGSGIGGSGVIELYDLEVAASAGADLWRNLTVQHELQLTAGKLRLNDSQLTLYGEAWGDNAQRYVQTNGAGSLVIQAIGSVYYPVGNDQYNPLLINHYGPQQLSVRVADVVYSQGQAGVPLWHNVVQAAWLLGGTPAGQYDVQMQWRSSQEGEGFVRHESYPTFYHQGWVSGPAGPAEGVDPYRHTYPSLTGTGVLAVASGGLLPATLANWRATAPTPGKVELGWETLYESGVSHFELAWSPDGRGFNPIAQVPAAGNSQVARPYTYTHANLQFGYYRLTVVDLDGTFAHQPLLAVDPGFAPQARLFPTLCTSDLTLWLPPAPTPTGPWWVVSAAGQPVRALNPQPGQFTSLVVADLAPGRYFVANGQGGATTLFFVKQ